MSSPNPRTHAPGRAGKQATEQATKTVRVCFYASARAAAGIEAEKLLLPDSASLDDAVRKLGELHPDGLPRVLRAASFLVDGVAARDTSAALPDGAQLDVLPPFAGG